MSDAAFYSSRLYAKLCCTNCTELLFSLQKSQSSSFLSTSSSSSKCGYNKHFPCSFLLNYGTAIQDPKEEAILRSIHDFNCKWLQRPNIAISELEQTLRENLPLLQQYSGTIFFSFPIVIISYLISLFLGVHLSITPTLDLDFPV